MDPSLKLRVNSLLYDNTVITQIVVENDNYIKTYFYGKLHIQKHTYILKISNYIN